MRKIKVSMWITLDGYVAGPANEMDWLLIDDDMMEYEQSFVNNADTLLLGRTTFTDFSGYWPATAKNASAAKHERDYAQRLDKLQKIVISETDKIPKWDETRRLSHIDRQEILDIKEQPGKDIVMYGSLSIVNALTELGLVDEYQLLVHPLYLRQGIPLFQKTGSSVNLELISAETFSSGVVLMKYRPA